MTYQVTPHTTMNVPLSEVTFNWKIRYTISSVDDKIDSKSYSSLDKKLGN